MIIQVNGEQAFQVLAQKFTISPASTDYELQMSSDGVSFSTLESVSANTEKVVAGVDYGSYFKMKGNTGKVDVTYVAVCSCYKSGYKEGINDGETEGASDALNDIISDITEPFFTLEAVGADVDVSIYRYSSGEYKLGTGTVSYSFDKGTWTQWFDMDVNNTGSLDINTTTSVITIPKGSKLYLKGTLAYGTGYFERGSDCLNFRFSGGKVKAGGNIYAFMNSNAHKHPFKGIDSRYNFSYLFKGCENLIEAPIFGDTGSADGNEYSGRQLLMYTFNGCKNLHRIVTLAYGLNASLAFTFPNSESGVAIFNMASALDSITIPKGWSVINGIYNIG